ncbi:hypothetical protein COLO4_22881 [Corchorus olitorius]|uniref:Uncharacterized protein n=1 Tax=Corchorus olitorius TaxID=93759 RepID=A0A1R3IJD0_9ROSI|nr:hypothetical protein COLO4_22881 [Corchorus olitorius]
MPSSSFLESGRQGAFRNHVDSLVLQRKMVARALLPPASQTEGVVAEMRGTEGLGKKENVFNCGVGEKNFLEGKGDNLAEFRAVRKDSSGPNSLEQLYANIPGVGLSMMDCGANDNNKFGPHIGKKIRPAEDINEAVSYSGPAKEYYTMMKETVEGAPFVVGTGEGASHQGRGKFKRVARDAARSSSAALGRQTDQNDGRKRSRDGFFAAAARQVGDDYISLGVDQSETGGKGSNGFIGVMQGRYFDDQTIPEAIARSTVRLVREVERSIDRACYMGREWELSFRLGMRP